MLKVFSLLLLLSAALPLFAQAPLGWGIVTKPSAAAYDKKGKATQPAAAGTLIAVKKQVKVNKAPAYYADIKSGRARSCILRAEDCVAYTLPDLSTPEAVADFRNARNALTTYYQLQETLDKLTEGARNTWILKSPAKRLIAVRKELAEVPPKERAYAKAQEAALAAGDNAKRLKYQELRKELRYRATGMLEEVKRLEAELTRWEATHPFDENAIRRSSPSYRRLSQTLERMKPQVEELQKTLTPLPLPEGWGHPSAKPVENDPAKSGVLDPTPAGF